MTDLDERETTTQPIAARRILGSATYDINATAIIRGDELPIYDMRFAQPAGLHPAAYDERPLTLADSWVLGDMLQDPPTGPRPQLPPEPPAPAPKPAVAAEQCGCCILVEKPFGRRGRRRREPRWALLLIGFAGGLPAGAVLLGSILAAVVR